MEIINKKISDLIPYSKNPRKNDDAVKYVMNSIKEFGFKVPIVIDKNNVIVAGHTRYKASKKLKLKEVPCIVADDLSEEQIKAFRLADNKVGEFAEWNFNLLDEELNNVLDINMLDFGFNNVNFLNDADAEISKKDKYTNKINIPQYEITGAEPNLTDLFDDSKTKELINKINKSNIKQEQKDFLKLCAYRHLTFNYSNIAEYYAHQNKDMQELMEQSALVIIDIDDAIKNGYVELSKQLNEMYEEDSNE